MPLFERKKSITVDLVDDNFLEVNAHFKDIFHEIKTSIRFDCGTRIVTRASAEMVSVPFDLCLEVCEKMRELEGLDIKRGVTKWVKEIVGGRRGCAHLADLVVDSVKAMAQVADFFLLPDDMLFDEKLEKLKASNLGICHTYSNLYRNPKFIGNRIE